MPAARSRCIGEYWRSRARTNPRAARSWGGTSPVRRGASGDRIVGCVRALLLAKPAAVIRYMDFDGDELPLVFIHGLGCAGSSHFSRLLGEPAIAGHRSIVIDLFGHGYSDRPADFGYTLEEHAHTVAQLVDHLGLNGCAVSGHSMGGAIAVTLAARRPDLVSQLILAEANLDPGGGFVSTVIASQTEAEFRAGGHQQLLDRLADLGFLTSVGSFRVCGTEALYKSAIGLVKGTEPSMRKRLYGMNIPRAFLIGERGLPDPETEELPKHGVDVLIVPEAGHDMAFDNPRGVVAAIQQALQPATTSG
jgi:pimeloyl-ACP methyl ester carboxylesterase